MNSDARTLEVAIAHGDTGEVTRLLDHQPDLISIQFPENVGLTPLMWACRNRHTTIVELLLSKGASVNMTNRVEANGDGGNTALWFTSQGSYPGTVPIARLLLDHGAEINAKCEHGTTAFFMAVVWVHIELVQYLLSRGADSALPNRAGVKALKMIEDNYLWVQTQEKMSDDMHRFKIRAPRMISFLKEL